MNEAPKKTHGLSKTVKGIIAGGVTLCVLGGALAVLTLTKPETTAESSSSVADTGENKILWHHENAEVKQVSITYKGSSYTVVRTDEVTKDDSGNDVANFTLQGFEKLPVDKILIRTVATRIGTVTAAKTVEENPQDLSRYGLSDPTAKVVGTLDDGTVRTVTVGDVSPLGSEQYVLIDGTVYTVASSSVSPFLTTVNGYLSCSITEELADDAKTIVEKVTIDRTDLPYDIVVEYDKFYAEQESGGTTASHIMTAPTPCNLNVQVSSPITHGMFGLTASSVYAPMPTDAQLAETGLDAPVCTVTMETDDMGDHKMIFGKSFAGEDGVTCYYGMYDDIDVIYTFTAEQAAWVTVVPQDIAAKLIVITYVWDIGSLTVEADGKKTLHFEGIGTSKDDYVVTCNGEPTDTERFRQLYAFLLKTAGENLCINQPMPTGKKLASITLERQDGLKTQTVDFYEGEGLKCFIVVDGVCAFECRKSYVDTLLKNMDLYATTEDFILSW